MDEEFPLIKQAIQDAFEYMLLTYPEATEWELGPTFEEYYFDYDPKQDIYLRPGGNGKLVAERLERFLARKFLPRMYTYTGNSQSIDFTHKEDPTKNFDLKLGKIINKRGDFRLMLNGTVKTNHTMRADGYIWLVVPILNYETLTLVDIHCLKLTADMIPDRSGNVNGVTLKVIKKGDIYEVSSKS